MIGYGMRRREDSTGLRYSLSTWKQNFPDCSSVHVAMRCPSRQSVFMTRAKKEMVMVRTIASESVDMEEIVR